MHTAHTLYTVYTHSVHSVHTLCTQCTHTLYTHAVQTLQWWQVSERLTASESSIQACLRSSSSTPWPTTWRLKHHTQLQDLTQLHVVSYSLSSKSRAFMLRPWLAKLCNSLYIKHVVNRHKTLLQPPAGSWGRASSVRWDRSVGVIVWSYLAIMPKSVAKVLTVAARSGDWEFWDLLTLTDNERQYRHDGLTGVDAACLLCVLGVSDPLLTIHLHAVCWQRCQSCTHQTPRQPLPDHGHHTAGSHPRRLTGPDRLKWERHCEHHQVSI